MIKPISVTVRFSESKSFEADKTYSVAEFEAIAYKVAASEPLGGAKTDILIGFDNGHSFEDHLCVGRSDDLDKGIEKRIKELKKLLTAQQEALSSEDKMQYGFIENIDLKFSRFQNTFLINNITMTKGQHIEKTRFFCLIFNIKV